jgi:hypothetical protein
MDVETIVVITINRSIFDANSSNKFSLLEGIEIFFPQHRSSPFDGYSKSFDSE